MTGQLPKFASASMPLEARGLTTQDGMLSRAAVRSVGFYPQILWTALVGDAKSSPREPEGRQPVGFLNLATRASRSRGWGVRQALVQPALQPCPAKAVLSTDAGS